MQYFNPKTSSGLKKNKKTCIKEVAGLPGLPHTAELAVVEFSAHVKGELSWSLPTNFVGIRDSCLDNCDIDRSI